MMDVHAVFNSIKLSKTFLGLPLLKAVLGLPDEFI
jgi:hypothetical protein